MQIQGIYYTNLGRKLPSFRNIAGFKCLAHNPTINKKLPCGQLAIMGTPMQNQQQKS